MTRTAIRLAVRAALGLGLAVLVAACSQPSGTPEGAAPAGAAADAGAYKTDLDMAELMAHVIDHAADGVWLNQGWYIDAAGERELFPTDDAGWAQAENAAATVAEASNLLLLPTRAVDDGAWADYAHDLHDASLAAMKAAEAREKQAFFDAGGAMYVACRDCHQRYILGEIPEIRPPAGPPVE